MAFVSSTVTIKARARNEAAGQVSPTGGVEAGPSIILIPKPKVWLIPTQVNGLGS